MALPSGGHAPAKVLRWIIEEAGKPTSYTTRGEKRTDIGPTSSADGSEASKTEESKVESLADMEESERQKWLSVILGENPDIMANRKALEETIHCVMQLAFDTELAMIDPIRTATSEAETLSEESMFQRMLAKKFNLMTDGLEVMHSLCDKNEVVFIQRGGIAVLLHLSSNLFQLGINDEYLSLSERAQQHSAKDGTRFLGMRKDEIRVKSVFELRILIQTCSILREITLNNPSMQTFLHSMNGVFSLLECLKMCSIVMDAIMDSEHIHYDNVHKQMSRMLAAHDETTLSEVRSLYSDSIQRLWASILASVVLCNPNMNTFLSERGYLVINERMTLLCDDMSILTECKWICRLIEYMLGVWSDMTVPMMELLDLWNPVEFALMSTHGLFVTFSSLLQFERHRLKKQRQQKKPVSGASESTITHTEQKMRLVVDIVHTLGGGIGEFMQRSEECRKSVMENGDDSIIPQLSTLLGCFVRELNAMLSCLDPSCDAPISISLDDSSSQIKIVTMLNDSIGEDQLQGLLYDLAMTIDDLSPIVSSFSN